MIKAEHIRAIGGLQHLRDIEGMAFHEFGAVTLADGKVEIGSHPERRLRFADRYGFIGNFWSIVDHEVLFVSGIWYCHFELRKRHIECKSRLNYFGLWRDDLDTGNYVDRSRECGGARSAPGKRSGAKSRIGLGEREALIVADECGFVPIDRKHLIGFVRDGDHQGAARASEAIGDLHGIVVGDKGLVIIFGQLRGIDGKILIGGTGTEKQEEKERQDKFRRHDEF